MSKPDELMMDLLETEAHLSASRTERMILGPPMLGISYGDLTQLRSPIVYVWARGEEVLYVGMSVVGVARPVGKHERLVDFQPGDMLWIWRCDNPAVLETMLIRELRPRLNAVRHDPNAQSLFLTAVRSNGPIWRAAPIARPSSSPDTLVGVSAAPVAECPPGRPGASGLGRKRWRT
jgi:hypothetical protein